MTEVEKPRRLRAVDVIDRQGDLLAAALTRSTPAASIPSFSVEQVKAVGGAMVTEWAVHVPVCEQYPDAEAAFDAAVSFADRLREKYPMPSANGSAP